VSDDKRFEPTPSRRRRARRDGNVARSNELAAAAAFAGAIAAATLAVPPGARAAADAVRETAAGVRAIVLDRSGADAFPANAGALVILAMAALAPALCAALAATACAVLQGGGVHLSLPHVEWKRLDPLAGVRRMAGAEAAVGAARAVLAFAVALAAMLPLASRAVAAAAASDSPGAAAADVVARTSLAAWCACCAVGAGFAIADYALARRRWLRGLRMSLDELKRETKENEGDPQARARRKTAHRMMLRGAIARTRDASFVVVNPEHVAVALRYAPPHVPVPTILVRALDEAAQRVKALARACSIPLVEDVALARLLYASGENGRPIPAETYVAVAQIVASLAREGLLTCERG